MLFRSVKADAGPHGEAGVPLLIVLRDVLGYVDSRKEARYALGQDSVLVNGTPVSEERRPIGMFDILAFREREEYYRVFPDEGGRLSLTPIDADAAASRLGKIVGKSTVAGGDVQVTLHDGTTLLVDEPYGTTDSLVIDNETKEVVAQFPYEEGALVTAVDGQHAGRIGVVKRIDVTYGSSANGVRVATAGDGADGGFETIEEYVVVIDENFVGDPAALPDGYAPADGDDEIETETETEDEDADAEAGTDGGDDE